MNRGAEQLKEKLKKRGAKAALAKSIGVEPYQVSHWLAGGKRKPNPVQRAFIEDVYSVGWRLWDEESKRRRAA
jgi:hypothetical protein